MVRVLHEATADVTAPDFNGWTPLHWAAMQLDDYSLDLLCAHVFDLDLEDNDKRTPLYMACVEGRDIRGLTDTAALCRCMSHMLTHHPNINFVDWKGYSILHYLAASWQYEPAELLLKEGAIVHAIYVPLHVSETRTADGGDPNSSNHSYSSIESASRGRPSSSAGGGLRTRHCRGMNALHFAAAATPLKMATGLGRSVLRRSSAGTAASNANPSPDGNTSSNAAAVKDYEPLQFAHQADMLRTLLKFGARPNAKDGMGRTPLMHLTEVYKRTVANSKLRSPGGSCETAAASTPTSASAKSASSPVAGTVAFTEAESEVVESLISAASTLISFGARWDDGSSALSELKAALPQLNVPALTEKWTSMQPVSGDELKIW